MSFEIFATAFLVRKAFRAFEKRASGVPLLGLAKCG